MIRIKLLISLIVLTLTLFQSPPVFPQEQGGKKYDRVVSLLPSITEILFALDKGDQVVGVTRFCRYPPEAEQKPKIGGLLDTSFEMVFQLSPDLVILEKSQSDQKDKLTQMGIETLVVETTSIQGILTSIKTVGEILGSEKAFSVTERIEDKIEWIQSKTKDLPSVPRVLITYLRPLGEGKIYKVEIAGNKTYFNDLIQIAGGKNAYEGTELITSPLLSAEGILRMNPDVIIEISTRPGQLGLDEKEVLKDWEMLPDLKAFQENRIHLLTESYINIPGPRLPQALDDLVRLIHPNVNWDEK